jgi:hypothetical protein
VLAAETTTPDDDRIVEALVRLRTEELQMEVNWRNVEAMPARRRAGADALEQVCAGASRKRGSTARM